MTPIPLFALSAAAFAAVALAQGQQDPQPSHDPQEQTTATARWVDPAFGEPWAFHTGYLTTPPGARVWLTLKFHDDAPHPAAAAFFPPDPATAAGEHRAKAIAIDPGTGDVYVAGWSADPRRAGPDGAAGRGPDEARQSGTGPAGPLELVAVKYDRDLEAIGPRHVWAGREDWPGVRRWAAPGGPQRVAAMAAAFVPGDAPALVVAAVVEPGDPLAEYGDAAAPPPAPAPPGAPSADFEPGRSLLLLRFDARTGELSDAWPDEGLGAGVRRHGLEPAGRPRLWVHAVPGEDLLVGIRTDGPDSTETRLPFDPAGRLIEKSRSPNPAATGGAGTTAEGEERRR